jgi:hypothetical protein
MMRSSILSIAQTLRSKHQLRGFEGRADKPHQHRYERRKLRQVLRCADWSLME